MVLNNKVLYSKSALNTFQYSSLSSSLRQWTAPAQPPPPVGNDFLGNLFIFWKLGPKSYDLNSLFRHVPPRQLTPQTVSAHTCSIVGLKSRWVRSSPPILGWKGPLLSNTWAVTASRPKHKAIPLISTIPAIVSRGTQETSPWIRSFAAMLAGPEGCWAGVC